MDAGAYESRLVSHDAGANGRLDASYLAAAVGIQTTLQSREQWTRLKSWTS